MKVKVFNIFKTGFAGLATMTLVVACGTKNVASTATSATTNTATTNTRASTETSAWQRLCSKPILFTNKASLENALQNYFFSTMNGAIPAYPGMVQNVEPPVNYCLRISSSNASFRLEYEDHFGGGWYEMTATRSSTVGATSSSGPSLYYSSLANDQIDLIFLDGQGFTEIVGSKGSDGYYTATLKFANLPSQSTYLNNYVQDQVTKCQTGQLTVAQCLGYSYQPNYSQTSMDPLTVARGMLNGGSGAQAYTIGTMRFLLSDILQ